MLDQVQIVVQPPTQATPFTIYTDNAAAARAGARLSAIEDVTVSWGPPTPYDHSDAGELRLVIRYAIPDAIARGSFVTVSAMMNAARETIAVAWIDEVTYARTSPGADVWRYELRGVDFIGLASGLLLNEATDWPEQNQAARLNAIRAALPLTLLDPAIGGNWDTYKTLEVTNLNALDTIRATIPSETEGIRFADAGAAGRITSTAVASSILVHAGTSSQVPVPPKRTYVLTAEPLSISAHHIAEADRQLSRATIVTQGSLGHTWRATGGGEAKDITTVIEGNTAPFATSDWKLDTHLVLVGDLDQLRIVQAVRAIVNGSEGQTPTLDATTILVDATHEPQAVPAATLPQLLAIDVRNRRLIRITDAPDDIQPAQIICRCTLTLTPVQDSTPRARLAVVLMPAQLAGILTVRWSDWIIPDEIPAGSNLKASTFALLEPDPVNDPTGSRALTFANLTAVRPIANT